MLQLYVVVLASPEQFSVGEDYPTDGEDPSTAKTAEHEMPWNGIEKDPRTNDSSLEAIEHHESLQDEWKTTATP